MRLQVHWPELIDSEDHLRLTGLGAGLTVSDGAQMLDAGRLSLNDPHPPGQDKPTGQNDLLRH
jgi:hypothetical protein